MYRYRFTPLPFSFIGFLRYSSHVPVTYIAFVYLFSGKSTFVNLVDSKAWLGGSTTITPAPPVTMSRQVVTSSPAHLPMMHQITTPPPVRRNVGGRRPAKSNGVRCYLIKFLSRKIKGVAHTFPQQLLILMENTW